MKRFFILLLFFIEVLILQASDGRSFLNIGMREGLSNEFVNDMVMDNQGFLWVATERGVNRISGKKCTTFTTYNSDILSDACLGLFYHKESNSVWMYFKTGKIDVFDCKTQSFRHFTSQPGMVKKSVCDIKGASDGGIWIAYHSGDIQHYDVNTKKFTTYSHRLFPRIQKGIRCLYEDGKGQLYIGLRMEGLYVYNLHTRKARFFEHSENNAQSLPGNNVRSICVDHLRNVWVGTNMGAALFDESTGTFRSIKPQSVISIGNNIHQITETNDHTLWFVSDINGVSKLNLDKFKNTNSLEFEQMTHENSNLSSNHTRRVLEDAFGNVWIGSFGTGVDFLSHSLPDFHTLTNMGLGFFDTSAIFCDHLGNLWIGQDGVINLYQNGMVRNRWNFSNQLSNSSASVFTFEEDHLGNIWFGTNDNGVMVFDIHTHQFKNYLTANAVDVHALHEDASGVMWIGSEDGIYSVTSGQLRKRVDLNNQMGKNVQVVYSIAEDNDGQMWVGTMSDGVFVFNSNKKLVAHLNRDNSPISNSINQILVDHDGAVWIATYGGLAYIENPQDCKKVKMYGIEQGLSDNHIRAICMDRQGNVWVSQFSGIACWDIRKQRFFNFTLQSGVPMGNFVEASEALMPDGSICFGSPTGVCMFNPQALTVQKPSIPVEIIGCERIGRFDKRSQHPLLSPDENGVVRLKYNDNTFKISFTPKDFAQEGRLEYSYMMKGLDEQWYETDGDNEVTFRNLKPGSYTFIVKAKFNGQDWDDASTAELKVVVMPPLWLTWWAKLIYVLLVLGVLWHFLRSYQKELLLRNSLALTKMESLQKQEVNEERLRFFTNITHELRTPLTLILGPLEDLMEDKRLPDFYHKKITSIHAGAERLLNLINDILDFRKAETQNRKLCVACSNLGNLVQEIGIRFKDLNHNPKVQVCVDVEKDTPDIYFDSEVILTVVNNLMSNAFKYTPEGKVTLHMGLSTDHQQVVISVEDTGYGISQEALAHICDRYYQENGKHQASGTGIGLALVKSLAKLHEAELKVESQEGKGSKFYLLLQVNNTYPGALHKDDQPVELEQNSVLEGAGQAEKEEQNQRPLLLIVEDNSDIREYIQESLQEDFRILQASNGKEGMDLAIEQMPDLIVSDIMMPEMDGIEMTKLLKGDIRTCHIPIILLTAKTSANDQEVGYDSGADSYLMKPFSSKLLMSRIRNILSGRRRLAEYIVQHSMKSVSAHVAPSNGQLVGQDAGRELGASEDKPVCQLNELDRKFLEKLDQLIENHIRTDDLDIAFMTDKMAMSHSTFYRKVKALTGMSANEYIKKAKLRMSRELLDDLSYTITDVAMMTGFNNMGNFRESFKREFGMTPSEYRKKK